MFFDEDLSRKVDNFRGRFDDSRILRIFCFIRFMRRALNYFDFIVESGNFLLKVFGLL